MGKLADAAAKPIARAREFGGFLNLPEGDEIFNDIQREIIAAMREERGDAWLGQLNGEMGKPAPVICQWHGVEPVCNFGAAFVIPLFDDTLEDLIKERHEAEYTGTKEDATRVANILERVHEIGGAVLMWT